MHCTLSLPNRHPGPSATSNALQTLLGVIWHCLAGRGADCGNARSKGIICFISGIIWLHLCSDWCNGYCWCFAAAAGCQWCCCRLAVLMQQPVTCSPERQATPSTSMHTANDMEQNVLCQHLQMHSSTVPDRQLDTHQCSSSSPAYPGAVAPWFHKISSASRS